MWIFFKQWPVGLHFPRDFDFAPRVSRVDDVLTALETDGQLIGRRTDVIRRLVPLAGGTIIMFLKMSSIGVEVWRVEVNRCRSQESE